MSSDDELGKAKFLLFFAVAWIASAFFAWDELKYLMRAKNGDADFVKANVTQSTGRRGRTRTSIHIEFRFQDAGALVQGADTLHDESWLPPEDGKLPIQYIPGVKGSARIAGNGHTWSLYVFGGCTIVALGFSVWLFMMARAAVSDGPRSRKRR